MVALWESALLRPELVQLAAIVLAGLASGGLIYVLVTPFLGDDRKVSKRVASAVQGQGRMDGGGKTAKTRRKQVQDTIKELEAQQKSKRRVTQRTKLIRANLEIAPLIYYVLSGLAGLLGAGIVFLTGSPIWVSLLVGLACGVGLPRWYLSQRTKRHQAKFLAGFANAVDIIVRGIKSGLPLGDCLQTIAKESPEPLRSEFIELVEQQKVGVPLASAFDRMYQRMPLQEVNFFGIVIAIQSQTGGNLAEALSNLAQVLRDRYRLQAKVKTFSAEAKASAMIIGVLPPLVILLVYLTAPEYISLLWNHKIGNVMLILSAIWMLMGVLVMRKMIRFDY
jgi:tight adherence protein B